MSIVRPSGPVPADIILIGEAPGKDEDILGVPFVGASGRELKEMLTVSGIDPASVRFTNVFNTRPENNDVNRFTGNRGSVPKDYPFPALSTGHYVLTEHLDCLTRLAEEIHTAHPRLIIAVGNTPCWALLQRTGISKLRGSVFACELLGCAGVPVLPTYHPSAVLRDWSLRTIAIHDFMKAKRFLDEGFSPKHRRLLLEPTLEEVRDFFDQFIYPHPSRLLSVDIETTKETITCIGFSNDPGAAITVPFYDPAKPDRNYWATAEEEVLAWLLCKAVLESDIPKLGQNFLYDLQYLYRAGIRVRNLAHDTMIRHHALHPELEKGLGFLGTMYTDEQPWKLLRDRNRDTFKLEDE